MRLSAQRQVFASWGRLVTRGRPKKAPPRVRGVRIEGAEADHVLTKLGWPPGIFLLEKTTDPLGLSVRWRTSMREQRWYSAEELERIQKRWVEVSQ